MSVDNLYKYHGLIFQKATKTVAHITMTIYLVYYDVVRNIRRGLNVLFRSRSRREGCLSFLRRRSAGVLLVWSLLLATFPVVNAEPTQVRDVPAEARSPWSVSLIPVSDIPQFEDRLNDRLRPISLQPDAYTASLEDRAGVVFFEDVPSRPEKASPLTAGVFEDSEAALLRTDRLSPLDETMTGRMDHIACNRMIPFPGAGDITRERSIFAGGDTLMASAPDPSEDRPCEKSDIPPDGDQVTGGVPGKDWSGIGRDTAYFVGYQFLAIGLLYVMPERVTNWTKEQKEEYNIERWWKNVKHPAEDDDKWYVNYLLHPYWGATYYIRARERGFDKLESFVYSAFLSTMYEFGAEALFEQPSYQDLIITPAVGTLLGMYVFEPMRERIKAKGPEQKWYDKMALVLTMVNAPWAGCEDLHNPLRTAF